jgi:actin-binding LIM protein
VTIHWQVTNTGKEILCEKCVVDGNPRQLKVSQHQSMNSSPTKATAQKQLNEIVRKTYSPKDVDPNNCAGCGYELKEGQALIALDRQWHIWCFR